MSSGHIEAIPGLFQLSAAGSFDWASRMSYFKFNAKYLEDFFDFLVKFLREFQFASCFHDGRWIDCGHAVVLRKLAIWRLLEGNGLSRFVPFIRFAWAPSVCFWWMRKFVIASLFKIDFLEDFWFYCGLPLPIPNPSMLEVSRGAATSSFVKMFSHSISSGLFLSVSFSRLQATTIEPFLSDDK